MKSIIETSIHRTRFSSPRLQRLAFGERLARDDGAAMVLVALVLPVLVLLAAGGIVGFSMLGSHRELQRAADQAALAGAASIPPVNPSVLRGVVPFPLPDTDPVYQLTGSAGLDIPRSGELAADPRSVACAFGAAGMQEASAGLTNAFDNAGAFTPPVDESGNPVGTVCDDGRVFPKLETNPSGTTPAECANRLAQEAGGNLPLIQPLVDIIIQMPVDHLVPAAFAPRMSVDVHSRLEPPMYSFIGADNGRTIRGESAALRRIKNAVVVPITPAAQVQIQLGQTTSIAVMIDPVNLNNALRTAQGPLIDTIGTLDSRLNTVIDVLGVPCQNMLYNLRRDLRDIYDPPGGPAPSALDVVDSAVEAQEAAAARLGAAQPDPTNPDSLAGEAFYLIGVSTGPISELQIPILDAALVVMKEVSEGDFRATVISASSAQGVFRSALVK